MTDDEIIEKGQRLQWDRNAKVYEDRLAAGKIFAEQTKLEPLVIQGLVKRTWEYSGATGDHDIENLTHQLSRLPEGTLVKCTIEVLVVGIGFVSHEADDND